MNFTSLALMITGFTGVAISCSIGGIGLYKGSLLTDSDSGYDFRIYTDMQNIGWYTAIGFGGLALTALIPFIVSFVIKPKSKKQALDIRYENNDLIVGCVLRL